MTLLPALRGPALPAEPAAVRRASPLVEQLGRGWDFPIAPSSRGALELAAGTDKVARSIWIILDTEPGERVMRPDFGCGLRRHLMAPNTPGLRALIQRDVERALAVWEPRIQVTGVQVDGGDAPELVLIRVAYLHVRDRRPGNLVYPLYLQ